MGTSHYAEDCYWEGGEEGEEGKEGKKGRRLKQRCENTKPCRCTCTFAQTSWGGGDPPEEVQVFNTLLPEFFTKRDCVQV